MHWETQKTNQIVSCECLENQSSPNDWIYLIRILCKDCKQSKLQNTLY